MGIDAVIVCGPLRKMSKKLAFSTGVVRRAECITTNPQGRHDTELHAGSALDVVFAVKSDGIAPEVMVSVSATFLRHRNHTNADHTTLPESPCADIPSFAEDSSLVVISVVGFIEPSTGADGKPALRVLQLHSMDLQASTTTTSNVLSVSKASKARRHDVFADWIVSTFGGSEGLAAGVVDVAGGKGFLSHALAVQNVPCKLVDPWAGVGRDPAKTVCPVHLVDEQLDVPLHSDIHCIRDTLQGALVARPDLITSCAAVVAMHPDEATEAIVDAALASGRPFAVVPCCVMPQLFPQRKLRNGVPVVKFGNFLSYLREKDSRIRLVRLCFDGCDTVAFMTLADYERPAALGGPRRPRPLTGDLSMVEIPDDKGVLDMDHMDIQVLEDTRFFSGGGSEFRVEAADGAAPGAASQQCGDHTAEIAT